MGIESKKQELRRKTCCFTGHRTIPFDKQQWLKECLERTLVELIQQGIIYFGAGGAIGFDTLAAQTVIELRERYPAIKLIMVLPCKTQADRWNERDKKIYEDILGQADKRVYISEQYYDGCMHARNRHLVDCSGTCVGYLTKNSGGTAYTVDYARKKGVRVINLA